jgi:hypothetical protein
LNDKRKIYLDIFNLQKNASKEEIKRRYRELAKEFHPDHNSDDNAHERFLLIKEAYEHLINYTPSINNDKFHSVNKNDSERYEKIRVAKEKLNEYYRRKELERINFIKNFYTSKIWILYKVLSFTCLFYSLLNIIDFILPKNQVKTIVTEISENYNGLFNEQIFLIKTAEGKDFFILSPFKTYIKYNDSVALTKSKIFNKNFKTEIDNNFEKSSFYSINNSNAFLIILSIILIIPTLNLINHKRKIENIFKTKVILALYTPTIIYLIISCFF